MIQIRTPLQKRMITLIDTALTQNQAFQNTSVARIGHHNDCFLASDDDWGIVLFNLFYCLEIFN